MVYLSLEFHLDGVALVISSSSLDFSPSITIWQLIKLYRELKVLGGSENLAMLFSLFSAHVCHEISFTTECVVCMKFTTECYLSSNIWSSHFHTRNVGLVKNSEERELIYRETRKWCKQ